MTNNQSNKNSQLNHVDLSLYEFLGTTWKDKENRKSNPEALEMLLIKIRTNVTNELFRKNDLRPSLSITSNS